MFYHGYWIAQSGNLVKVFTASGKYLTATTMSIAHVKVLIDSWVSA